MMKKTKIICTLGPATNNEEAIKSLVKAGMNGARFNFSHGDHDEHLERINMVKNVAKELNTPIALILDTKGPEIRTGKLENGEDVELVKGEKITVTTDYDVVGNTKKIAISYEGLADDVKLGDRLLLDDGLIELDILDINGKEIECIIMNGGVLGEKKGMNVPNVSIKLPALTKKDIEDIKFGIKNDIDYIAASFIRSAEDVKSIKDVLKENNGESVHIISKIENQEGVDNIDEILDISEGIMVARGDLGVEIPTEEMPIVQKMLIRRANEERKIVVTATQMLDSMIRNPRPTRAEVTDVANAIFDGSDVVMLSGETAKGKYATLAVKTMASIAKRAEDVEMHYEKCDISHMHNITDTVAKAACSSATDINAKAIISVSETGRTPKKISKNRPNCPVIGFTINEKIYRQLSLVWGCVPAHFELVDDFEEFVQTAKEEAKRLGIAKTGDIVVITAGVPLSVEGTTNLMEIRTIK